MQTMRSVRFLFIFPLVLALIALGHLVPMAQIRNSTADLDAEEFFEKKIRPVLADRCYSCHSLKSEKLKGGLLLDSREEILAGGDTGPAAVPGDPERSLLIKAIRYGTPDLQMPPKERLAAD